MSKNKIYIFLINLSLLNIVTLPVVNVAEGADQSPPAPLNCDNLNTGSIGYAECEEEQLRQERLFEKSGGYGTGQLPTITVEAIKPSPFPSIYDPWGTSNGGSGGGGGSISSSETGPTSSSEDTEFVVPAFTQTQCSADSTSNPIMIANGKKIQQELDFTTTGEMPLAFIRYYDSFATRYANFSVNGKWRHNFDYRLAVDPQGKRIRQLPNGENYYFNELTRIQKSNNEWIVSLPDGGVEIYMLNGRLLSKKNAYGIGWILSYNENNRLIKVTHTNGRSIDFTWNQDGMLSSVTDPSGKKYNYIYDMYNYSYKFLNIKRTRKVPYLASVTYPDSLGSRTYHYGENGARPQVLSGISINGKRYNSYYFDGKKAVQSGRSDGTQVDKLTYADDYTIVTNPLGAVIKYIYTDNQKNKLAKVERSGVNNCPNSSMENTYDNNGYVISTKDWNGVETQYQRDRFGRVTQETIGIQNGNASNAYIKKYSYLGETSLITQIQMLDGSNRLIREETYSYYAANEPAKNRLKSQTICSKTGTTTCSIIAYGYRLHTNGMLSAVVINRNGKNTVYSYAYEGGLSQIKNALGHAISYFQHNRLGLTGQVIYPNDFIESYNYDARGQLERITPIWADIIGSRNILLNRRINECVAPSLRDAIDNLSSIPVESTRRIFDFCLREVLLQIQSSDFYSAGMILNLIHNLPLTMEKAKSWDVDYFLSIELSTFLENFEIIISARKIVFFICGELSPKYIE